MSKSIIKCQTFQRIVTKKTSPSRLLRIVSTDFLPCVCFASMYASTAAKSYVSNYMWTAANFIIADRMRPCGRRLCTVALSCACMRTHKNFGKRAHKALCTRVRCRSTGRYIGSNFWSQQETFCQFVATTYCSIKCCFATVTLLQWISRLYGNDH